MVVNVYERYERNGVNNSFSKYQTQNLPDRFKARNTYTTEDRTPYSSTRTVYWSVRRELPEKKEMTYQEANIPESEKKRIARRDIVRTSPESRREYYKQIDEYNRKISEAKREVDSYNQQIREYNKQRIYYERVPVNITTQGEKITYTTKEARQTPATGFSSRFTLQKPEISETKILSYDNQEKISNLLANYKPMVTVEDTRKTSDFLSAPPKLDTKTYFGVGTDEEVPKQNLKLLYKDPYLFGARFEQKMKGTSKYSLPLSLESFSRVGGGFVSGFFIKPAQLTRSLVDQPVPTLKALPGGIVRSLNPVSIYKSVTSDPYWSAGEIGAAVVSGYTISKIPSTAKIIKYEVFGTKVAPESLYSPIAMKSARGLDLTYNPSKTIKKFKSTFGKTKELPDQFVGVTQTQVPTLGKKVLTRAELEKKGFKQGSEPGLFVSPKGAGQTGFLGISDKAGYKFTLNPLKIFSPSKPTTFQIGFKELSTYPKSILKSSLNQKNIEAFQIASAKKSTGIITRMSSLGTKLEPEIIIPVTSRFLKVKTPLYYTKVKGTIVPIKTLSVAGESTSKSISKIVNFSKIAKQSKAYSDLLKGSVSSYYTINPISIMPTISRTTPISKTPTSISTSPSFSKVFSISSPIITSKISSSISTSPNFSKVFSISSPIITSKTSSSISTSPSFSKVFSISSPIITSKTSSSISASPSFSKVFSISSPIITSKTSSSISTSPSFNKVFSIPSPIIVGKSTPFGFKLPSKTREEKAQPFKSDPAYNTYVKVGNNWKKVNMASEKNDINKAVSLGVDVTDNTSARSFKVKKGTGSAQTRGFMPSLYKFYQPSKRKSATLSGAYIEKSKYLIDTPGEVRGITAKGWIANRNKTRRLI